MARIMIYEDQIGDVGRRYESVVKNDNHEVKLWYVDAMGADRPGRAKEGHFNKCFKEYGFELKNVQMPRLPLGELNQEKDWYDNPPQADVYFLDGLSGKCMDLLERLPKDKTFLNSTDERFVGKARELGYQLLDTSPEEAIERVVGRSGE